MSQKEGENLPSVNDFLQNQEDLPSLDSFKEENLPSIEEFVVQPEENNSETIEDANGESFLEVIDVVKAPEWQELVRLVNDVRKDIPEIPEIKYYDDELGDLSEKIIEIQDNLSRFDLKSDKIYNLDAKNEEFEVKLTEIESKIPEIPEIKQYDGDIEYIYKKIDIIKEEISSLPEVKYYESDLEALKTKIQDVKESIPTFPDWVQKVEEVPDFSWIGKTFSIIDDDFNKVQGHLDLIKEKIDFRVSELNDNIETKDFELKVDVKNIIENHQEVKNNIFNELKETSVKVWEHHREFKDDDRKLKKAVLSEQNKLKQSLQEQIKEIDSQSVKADEALLKFFTELKETVDVIPEVKYYDEDISNLREEINKEIKSTKGDVQTLIGELYKIASVIKKQQKTISEGYLLEDNPNLPGDPSTNNSSDGLTPLDQKFVTLDQLQEHYRLFINRVQQQISTIGGGGETRLQYLDDIAGISTDISAYEGMTLIVDTNQTGKDKHKKFRFGGSVGAGGTWSSDTIGVSTTKNVGIATTARTDFALYVGGDQYVDGNITVGGTITYEDVKNVDSIGIVTARSGINVLAGGINAVGVVTATSFIGDGSGLTGIANTAIINSNQINVSGVVTASSFIGDGSGLSNIISGVGIQSGSVRVGTGFTDVNFTGVGITVVGSGTTITVNIPSTTITRQIETSSGITTNFTVTNGYTVGFIDVFRNGSKQITGVDFTATNGSTVTMVPAVSDGDVVEFQKFNALNIAGIASVTNATNAYNIVGGVSFATSAGIATALNSDSSINTSGIITASSLDAAISEWVLGANGSSDYTFTGPGLTGAENDPSLYLIRGQKYNFKNSSGGHPFRIQSTPNGSTGTQYNDGVTNNDAGNGTTLIWNVQFDAPEVLYYQCTSHSSMGGKIYIGNSGESIVVGSAVTINSSGINVVGVITATSFDGVPEGTNILKAMLFV